MSQRPALDTPRRTARTSSRRAIELAEAPVFTSENALRAFLIHLAEETRLSERSARLDFAHLQRFAVWLAEQHEADLIGATSHDMRAYRGQLTDRQAPASVNAALAALRRF